MKQKSDKLQKKYEECERQKAKLLNIYMSIIN